MTATGESRGREARYSAGRGLDTHQFELSAGSLCLDFANTVDERPLPRSRDNLCTYSDLCGWAEQAGILDRRKARALKRRGGENPQKAQRVLSRAKSLRESLFGVLSDIARREEPDQEALDSLNKFISGSLARLVLVRSGDGFVRRFTDPPHELEHPLHAVALSAFDLLTSPSLDRLRLCAAQSCDWLFLDQSKNRSRRWCDMSVCGNRAKARRHYRKKKGE